MHIVSFYKLCEVITVIYSITRPFNDRVSLRLKKMIIIKLLLNYLQSKREMGHKLSYFFLSEFILKLGNISVLF